MKAINKLVENIHWFIIVYAFWGAYEVFDAHTIRMEELNNSFAGIDAQIVSNSKKVREIQEFIKRAEESKVRVEEVAKNIESVQKQLPADINDNQIITFLSNEVKKLNIKDPVFVPGTEKPATYFISKDYSIKAKGTFLQFLVFLESIGNATRIYNVKSLKLVDANPEQRGRFHLMTATECRNGGWASFSGPTFKNQGACVSSTKKPRFWQADGAGRDGQPTGPGHS